MQEPSLETREKILEAKGDVFGIIEMAQAARETGLNEKEHDMKQREVELCAREKAINEREKTVKEKERVLRVREDAVAMEKKHALAIYADTMTKVRSRDA